MDFCFGQMRHTRLPAGCDAETAAQLAVVAAMDKAEHRIGRDRRAVIEKAVERLVDGAVPAHREDLQMTVAQGIAHHMGGLGGRGGDEEGHQRKDLFQRVFDFAPVASGAAAPGVGIENNEGCHDAVR
jgi:hypothetical protein